MDPAENLSITSQPEIRTEEPDVEAVVLKEGAGFGIRLVARLIDIGVGYGIGMGSGLAAGFILAVLQISGVIDESWQSRIPEGNTVILFASGLLGVIVYHTFCEWIHGATLGKLICRIRVVREDGRPCGFMGALIRSIAYWLDSLLFGVIAYYSMEKTRLSQRNGDVWGKTAVIKTALLPESSRRSIALFILGMFLGFNGALLCMVAGWLIEVL